MDPAHLDAHLRRLADAIRRARGLRDPAGVRIWQHDCEGIVRELSGGSKSHWLSRAYSEALLVRAEGRAVERADPTVLVDRIVEVLERAVRSLVELRDRPAAAQPAPHRFDFVHDRELRPVLEQAYAESRVALDERQFERSLATTCSILEAIITDALRQAGLMADVITELSFAERIAAAEQRGLIRRACARLTPAARQYRESADLVVFERDARVAGQVLHVVMRDLDPGR